ncbi:MAG: nitroreductase family protein [Planctomycetota bacterium]
MSLTEIFEKIPDIQHDEAAPETNSAEFEKVVRSRRSVRAFENDPVPEEVMRKCLDLTLLAPNSSNLQPWEFYWVREPQKKAELARLCLGQPAATTAQELVVCVARLDTWKRNCQMMIEMLEASDTPLPDAVMTYYKKVVPLAYGQGPFYLFGPVKKLIGSLVAFTRPLPRGPASKADMRVWAHKTTALACENLMLSLRAFGFDSCPIEGLDSRRIQILLNLPRTAEICMVISAGKRAKNGIYGRQLRCDKSLFVFEV